ncbi:MAG: stage III sporulation protein AA [Lachnospiraceae bacterium]|nr:stage III sporulation protein AA [Lachnospiraceae bacterium]
MDEIINVFPSALRPLCRVGFQQGIDPEEIRLRIGRPVMVLGKGREYYWNLRENRLQNHREGSYVWREPDMKETLSRMSQYSMYALEEELRSGFFTIQGGHRVGVAGRTVCERGKIQSFRNICSLNVRVARQKKDCARGLLAWIAQRDNIYNTLILSPPGVGKTTMLRDCIRLLSNGTADISAKKIGVVDERSEIAACFFGVPQNDLGDRTDVLDACPKAEGMRLLLRSMSPQIIAVDELGGREDCYAVEEALHCGCRILGTMHAQNTRELQEKVYLKSWLEKEFFGRFVFLSMDRQGERNFAVYDERMQRLC